MDYPLSMHNSLACQRDQKTQAQQPLTIEDVFEQSRKLGRTSIRLTTSGQAIYKTIVMPGFLPSCPAPTGHLPHSLKNLNSLNGVE